MSNIEAYSDSRSLAVPTTSAVPLSRAWRQERSAMQRFVSNELDHRERVAHVQREAELNQERAIAAGSLVARNLQIVDALAVRREQIFAEAGDSLRSKDADDIVTQGMQQIAALQARCIQRLG